MCTVKRALAAALLAFAASGANAFDRLSGVAGRGSGVNVVGIEFGSPDIKRWRLGDSWQLSAYAMASLAYWRASASERNALYDLGIAPVVRLQKRGSAGFAPYAEASFGAHLLSHNRINGRDMSSAFQFGEFAGVGVLLGPRREFGIGVRVQHVSNGGIRKPNQGLSFGSFVLHYQF
jgi:lipid A 3-O-deacylase